ncbi:MAG: sodium:calcium antiporter [Bacteroidetes bacterium]|nr:MAG: sodium:calcium antiporter [Bacteroidota bacterium]MBL1145647.1 sodium:calcium antiporter [Bacteroidota bacterium]NOG58441.1 calcium/sodium antiporter [Bacteroidota bacterium]
MEYLLLVTGFVVLILGGEFLVRGAVSLALKLNISPLVVGMTIVSFGTSAPELLVSIEAAITGHPDVSMGAVVGSNISNISLVLGLTVLIFPISISKNTLKIDWPLMMVASILLYILCLDGVIDFKEGILFIAILASFTAWLFIKSRKKGEIVNADLDIDVEQSVKTNIWRDLLFLFLGFTGLFYGADWLIGSVVEIATNHGISEKLISVTVVAFGTSLPELVTSCMAAFRKETDISIGNLIGSNLFNILAILGITSLIEPIAVSDSINHFDMYYMLGISLLVFPLMYFGRKVGRLKGLLLVSVYIIYIYFSIVMEKA